MTTAELYLIEQLMCNSISKADFLQHFTADVVQNPNYVLKLLGQAYTEKRAEEVEYSLFIGFSFDLFTKDYVGILCNLIKSDWHVQHENIAMILQKLKSPASIESLYHWAITPLDYLDYDDSYALAVKCIWALGDINTGESRRKLKLLAESDNEIIRNNVLQQQERTIDAADKIILAQYNKQTVRVYQAYNHKIADEVVSLGRFGPSFKIDRMTWIKPSFLWMMYRAGWATKTDQERILAIDITREGFNQILSQVVLSSYDPDLYGSQEDWQTKLQASQVRCQWDPDRDIRGNKLPRRAIQLGLRGEMVHNYIHRWIVEIHDITEYVADTRKAIESGKFSTELLPKETPYPVENSIKRTLGII